MLLLHLYVLCIRLFFQELHVSHYVVHLGSKRHKELILIILDDTVYLVSQVANFIVNLITILVDQLAMRLSFLC